LILPPNDHQIIKNQDIFTTLKSSLIKDKCVQCKKCVDEHFCEFNALEWDNEINYPSVNYLACEGCSACRILCPEHAFNIELVKSGELISYTTTYGFPLVYGRTRLGSSTSGKLVSNVKDYAKKLEEFDNSNLLIIDGPPGIGCPVIATVSGLDYAITITEPTPSGLHDLNRAIDLINQFKIPFGIIVNKCDLDSPFQKKFKKFIKKTGYNVLGKIPFDLSIPNSISFAKPLVEFLPNSKSSIAIKSIYDNLKNLLWNQK
jgi:MinD superfamily P-loop ATPase